MSVPGSVLSDCVTYVRRIIKSPPGQTISDLTILDYINRFYMYDVPVRLQLFELKRQYTFLTVPYINQYNFPFGTSINEPTNQSLQGYQFLRSPVYVDGVQIPLYISDQQYYLAFPDLVTNLQPLEGDGTPGPYDYEISGVPLIRGHRDVLGNLTPYVFVTAEDASGEMMYLVDDGEGNLFQTDSSFQVPISLTPSGAVDYETGEITEIIFSDPVPATNKISIQWVGQSPGRPVGMLFFNNVIRIFPMPNKPYKIQADAWITPAQFLDTAESFQFAYLTEYLARGAARKIMIDNRDIGQMQFYESFFHEAEMQALRRSEQQRQQERVPTIFSGNSFNQGYYYNRF